jgi:hypothetical protein
MRIRILALLLFVAPLAVLSAQADAIGEIVYLDGDVSIVRNNRELDFIDIGDRIENFDQLTTGAGGTVEVALYPETGITASIIITAETVMYFDLSALRGEQQGAIELITGRIELTVGRLSGNNQLDIRTSSAIMGVRGTAFSVTSTLGGDILLAASEGRVECRTGSNQVLFAVPGEVVEKSADARWRNLRVDPDALEDFRENWFRERIAALDANAPRAVAAFARRYVMLKEDFIQAYVRLMNNREIIQKWMDEDRIGTVGGTAERLREKRQIIGSLLNVRMRLFLFERVYYRLSQLMVRYDDIPGNTEISPGLNFRTFRRQFEQDSLTMERRMREVRYVIKLYALRNEGSTPFEAFTDLFNAEGGFFGESDGFFGD